MVAAGRNEFHCEMLGEKRQFTYETPQQFVLFYNGVADGIVDNENIPVEKFNEIKSCDAFLDIGAYHGLYSTVVGRIFEDIDIFVFEPSSTNREILEETIRVNNIDAVVRGDVVTGTSGEVTFYADLSGTTQGHSTAPREGARKINKEAIALSDFCAENNIKCPFIKIDSEGEEYEIIRDVADHSGFESLRGFIEIHPDKMSREESELLTLLDNEGFETISLGDPTASDFHPRPAYYFHR